MESHSRDSNLETFAETKPEDIRVVEQHQAQPSGDDTQSILIGLDLRLRFITLFAVPSFFGRRGFQPLGFKEFPANTFLIINKE